ncbi:MAG: HDOD domain-containing protein [Candidatus Hydrogenedentes bacterium]|nr:HDOD domain-containing protein [Candidatus Hydrogenedentota bacterium]
MAEETALLIIECVCGQKMKAPAAAVGKVYKCVRCGEHVQVRREDAKAEGGSGLLGKARRRADDAQEPIGQLLINQGIITKEQLAEVLAVQNERGGKTFEILIQKKYLDKDELHRFLSRQPGVAAIDLSRLSIDRTLIELIPKQLALDHLVLPIDKLGKLLTVAMACPLDAFTIAEVENITGLKVKAMLCRLDDIHKAVKKYYPDAQTEETSALYKKILATAPAPAPTPTPAAAPQPMALDFQHLEVLPCSARVLKALLEKATAANGDVRPCVDVLLLDPPLASLILRKANAPAYGLPAKVDSIPMAATVLGAAGIVCVAQQIQEAGQGNAPAALDALALHARQTAAAAQALAVASGKVGRALAQTAGLLAEIGRYALHNLAPGRYEPLLKPLLRGKGLAEEERKLFSTDFAETGAELAHAWRLPEQISAAISFQLAPGNAGPAKSLAALLQLSTALAGSDPKAAESAAKDFKPALEALGLSPQKFLEALAKTGKS